MRWGAWLDPQSPIVANHIRTCSHILKVRRSAGGQTPPARQDSVISPGPISLLVAAFTHVPFHSGSTHEYRPLSLASIRFR